MVSAARAKRAVDKYTTRYDNIDIDRIVASRRLLLNYVNCLLDKGPCTAEGKELKSEWSGWLSGSFKDKSKKN